NRSQFAFSFKNKEKKEYFKEGNTKLKKRLIKECTYCKKKNHKEEDCWFKKEDETKSKLDECNRYTDKYLDLKQKVNESINFILDEKVLLLNQNYGMSPKYDGPDTIKKKTAPSVYLIEENKKLTFVRRLKKFIYDVNDLNWNGLYTLEEKGTTEVEEYLD